VSRTDIPAKPTDANQTLYGNFVKSIGDLFSGKGKETTTTGGKNHLLKCKSIMVIFFGKGKETTTTGGKIIF
jgi:hypothetical protein